MPDNKEGLKNLLLSLVAIALLSGGILGVTHAVTEPVIAQGRALRLKTNLSSILGDFDNDPSAEAFKLEAFPDLAFYPAKNDGQLTALGVQTVSRQGYAGDVVLLAGFAADGSVIGVVVQQQRETPGLGTKMKEPRFLNQFPGIAGSGFPLRVKKDGGNVDALTAATISSRAFLDALNLAQKGALAILNEATKPQEANK